MCENIVLDVYISEIDIDPYYFLYQTHGPSDGLNVGLCIIYIMTHDHCSSGKTKVRDTIKNSIVRHQEIELTPLHNTWHKYHMPHRYLPT